MSEAKFFPLKKFLIVNRGDEIPENVTVLCDGGPKQLPSKEGRFRSGRGFSPRGLPPICCHFDHEILSDATLVR